MATVRRWTGHEAHTLRVAKRMSVRQFAEHLGVTAAAVSNWERRGLSTRLRYETQQLLDVDLARAPDDVRERFEQSLATSPATATGTPAAPMSPTGDTDPPSGPWSAPGSDLGDRSAVRTRALLDATARLRTTSPSYLAPVDAVALIDEFTATPSRVLLLKGPAGSGKTRLTFHLAEQTRSVDFQLHNSEAWGAGDEDLPTQILRYASIDAGADALLRLERECATLRRPMVVVIDGPRSEAAVHELGRQVDLVLRQVLTDRLRMCLVLRTPPDVDLAAYPVLAATIWQPPTGAGPGASVVLTPWTLSQAREIWNHGRSVDEQPFDRLPARVRQLARLPLYMQLLKTAGAGADIGTPSAYRLVDFCVRSIAAAHTGDVDALINRLGTLAESELPGLLPNPLAAPQHSTSALPADPLVPPLIQPAPAGTATFTHDVIREYVLASRLAQRLQEHGRSAVTLAALNELASRARASAPTRGVLEFAIQCLDASTPELLCAVALSPTVSITSTMPLMLELAGEDAAFATDEVLRSCASRSLHDSGLALAKALLTLPRLAAALGGYHGRWLVEVLRQFGSAVWPETVRYAEAHLSAAALRDLLEAADLTVATDAVFFARHAGVVFGDDPNLAGQLKTLLEHPDWRVRAALADGLCDRPAPLTAVNPVVDVLARDRDYKVRAAVAEALGQIGTEPRTARLLAHDDNWHVRERLIRGLIPRAEALDEQTYQLLTTDPSWRECPHHVRAWLHRLLLLTGRNYGNPADTDQRALFGLLREIRTGALRPPAHIRAGLTALGQTSPHWLVRAELAEPQNQADPWFGDIRGRKEAFRRLRDSHSLQIALDLHDLSQALAVAKAAAAAGAQFIEIGDPLIKSAGVAAIEHVKRAVPHTAVVAEMMSSDWGRDQVILAAQAGADIVLLIGPASTASVGAAVEASRRLAIPVVLDVPAGRLDQPWAQAMERAGIDGFAITTNIDLGVAGPHPLDQARALRSWTRLPVAVSGGFGTADELIPSRHDWDILVVGRSVTESVDPTAAAHQLINHITAHPSRTGL